MVMAMAKKASHVKSNLITIAAIATPSGRGGIGVIRVSGSRVREIAGKILGKTPSPRTATFTEFKNPNGETLDEGIALFFPGPRSFTGEDVLELQGHGGQVVLDQVLQCCIALGAQLAQPGEFSQRAFLNGKMDLAQAEAIADLIDASSQQAARSALRSLQGEFSRKVDMLLRELIQLRMLVEASIDFPEEEIDFLTEKDVAGQCENLIARVSQVQTSARQGALLRDGMTVVIAGKPNAGKSSLLNCLAKRDSAIVTDVPGTTRDVLREYIQINGMPLHIIDTAGLRDTSDVVEKEGIKRAWQEIAKADLVILVVDAIQNDDAQIQQQIQEITQQLVKPLPVLVVKNKIDLSGETSGRGMLNQYPIVGLSARQQVGIAELESYLQEFMGFTAVSEDTFIARRRHLEALERVQQHLHQALMQFRASHAGELLAADLQFAQQALSEITGVFSADDLLGEIFSNFCIGK